MELCGQEYGSNQNENFRLPERLKAREDLKLTKECNCMNKKVILTIVIIVVLVASFLIGTGFMERTDVVLSDYAVIEDGSAISLGVQVASSMGYVRGFKDNGGGVKPHYLTFYSTFGGLNSSFGTENSFVLEIGKDDTEIYFNRPNGGYELVLVKNIDTGEWERPVK